MSSGQLSTPLLPRFPSLRLPNRQHRAAVTAIISVKYAVPKMAVCFRIENAHEEHTIFKVSSRSRKTDSSSIQSLWRSTWALESETSYFPIVDTCLSCEDIARQSCAMVPRWRFLATFLGPAFAASRVQHISDLHSEFALGPHHVSKYIRHPICGR